jgi:regulator of protease activity HflC (stomatin/prohibitin superfamily)
MTGLEVFIIIAVLAVLGTFWRTVRIVPQARVGIIQRLGNYHRTAESGVAIVLPFVDKMLPMMDMREQVVSFQPQPVITSDNVTINVTSVVYYSILDAKNATYQVANYLQAMEQLTQTTLRNIFGGLTLDTSLTSRDEINARLRLVLDEVTEKWGIRVNRVELKDITPPKDIQLAMEKQMQAERNKRAAVLTADGEKQSAILRAEGQRQSMILQSEGERQAAMLRAEGDAQALITMQEAQAKAINTVFKAVTASEPTEEVMQDLYLQMLPRMAENPANKLIVVPSEMGNLAGLASTLFNVGQGAQEDGAKSRSGSRLQPASNGGPASSLFASAESAATPRRDSLPAAPPAGEGKS